MRAVRPPIGAAVMQQGSDWLEKLGLGQYAQRFAENDIDFSVLPHLTDADLEKIGVSLGHRRKILAAIAELAGSVQSPPHPVKSEPKPQDTAERQQVTVMFSDLVGSTAPPRAFKLKMRSKKYFFSSGVRLAVGSSKMMTLALCRTARDLHHLLLGGAEQSVGSYGP
jgi:hypothetical protein